MYLIDTDVYSFVNYMEVNYGRIYIVCSSVGTGYITFSFISKIDGCAQTATVIVTCVCVENYYYNSNPPSVDYYSCTGVKNVVIPPVYWSPET
jgi:hypothetical protein